MSHSPPSRRIIDKRVVFAVVHPRRCRAETDNRFAYLPLKRVPKGKELLVHVSEVPVGVRLVISTCDLMNRAKMSRAHKQKILQRAADLDGEVGVLAMRRVKRSHGYGAGGAVEAQILDHSQGGFGVTGAEGVRSAGA